MGCDHLDSTTGMGASQYFLSTVYREKRRQSQEKEHVEKQLLKRQRRDLDQLDLLKEEVDAQVELQDLKKQRKQARFV